MRPAEYDCHAQDLWLNLVTDGCVEVCELRTSCNLFPLAPIRLRCRYAIFYAARDEPGESESIISTTLLFAACFCTETAWV
jgi:hypothetical protein